MIIAICLLLTGALFGIFMFVRHLKRRALPKWAAILHGAFGAAGFGVVLFLMVRTPGMAFARDALMILIGAIVLGAVNLVFHLRRVRHRTVLIVVHALTAVAGVLMLGYGVVAGADAGASQPTPPIASAVAPPSTAAPEHGIVQAAAALTAPTANAETPAPAATPEAKAAPASPAEAAAVATLLPGPAWTTTPVIFEGASAGLDGQAKAALSEVAKDLQAHPEVTSVEVQGHADERGESGLNIHLTHVRAAAALEFLVTQGVARSRLRSVGYGSRCPADPECQQVPAPATCHQAASWQHDRRVSLVVVETGGQRLTGKITCDRGMGLAVPDRRPR